MVDKSNDYRQIKTDAVFKHVTLPSSRRDSSKESSLTKAFKIFPNLYSLKKLDGWISLISLKKENTGEDDLFPFFPLSFSKKRGREREMLEAYTYF